MVDEKRPGGKGDLDESAIQALGEGTVAMGRRTGGQIQDRRFFTLAADVGWLQTGVRVWYVGGVNTDYRPKNQPPDPIDPVANPWHDPAKPPWVSEDLTLWLPLSTNRITDVRIPVTIHDRPAANLEKRFYRVRPLPALP